MPTENRMFYPNTVAMHEPEPVLLMGEIATDGSGVVSSSGDDHRGFTCAKTDTGEYTITLNGAYGKVLGLTFTKVGPTAYDGDFQEISSNPLGVDSGGVDAQTVNFQFLVAGVASAFASKSVRVQIWLKNTKPDL